MARRHDYFTQRPRNDKKTHAQRRFRNACISGLHRSFLTSYLSLISPHTSYSYLIPRTSSLIHHTRSTWVSSPSHLPSSAKRPRWALSALLQATLRRLYYLKFALAANILLCVCAVSGLSLSLSLCLRVSVSVSVSECVVRACMYGWEHYTV